ncbi:type I-F CRISPR-associated helicase Cas3 [Paraburkholderia sp. Ac-20340]|uniref:type I-F CRISPR-associated helicase Cas3f n=1 Tax=Paraburkholderia sp. Ac-20340 TaxID=2703888 RepID=UPI00197DC690|nr:type I-F CRISPR-associated helicase Cas3f [Paraburkholderia sp. Ac-20340]MBN3857922.1 type I-F CRISPR-associated helicase Cas3 [Paraburkholderia sp. Ac-20340]
MNVIFVSQCTKRALTETRRILDQFAERRGDRSWQTAITRAGLDTVHKLLRETARKNTAVACHWIRGIDHSELLWVVGDTRQFNEEGATPTNTTTNDILRANDENNWHNLATMTALCALAALMHDLGKATQAFQDRLRNPRKAESNHYRHEWVSVRLFQAFVGKAKDDAEWLSRLASSADEASDVAAFEACWLDYQSGRLCRDGVDEPRASNDFPFASMPPLASAVAWLVLTHHRLPCAPVSQRRSADDGESTHRRWNYFGAFPGTINRDDLIEPIRRIGADWNAPREEVSESVVSTYWTFPFGLPVSTPAWRKQAARFARQLLSGLGAQEHVNVMDDAFIMHISRLCLMLADHHYSSIEDEARRKAFRNMSYPLYANSRRPLNDAEFKPKGAGPAFNQTLDEHLLGVQAHASQLVRSLPTLARGLNGLRNHRGLRKRNANPRFQWQDKAMDLASVLRERTAQQGAFIVNMASTGCGKTLANARIMNALADPQRGLRCAFAIGLRTLTLQTGRSFQRDLNLNSDTLAIMVGGGASRALFEYGETKAELDAEASGSASTQGLLDDEGYVDDRHPLLERLSNDSRVRALIGAPLLVCTIDHLMPATESLRGGHQIAPMLRLLGGDLVLDEPDDFDMDDLPALTRLVHWAGVLGSRVLLSSATLPPAMVRGLFLAYLEGRRHFQCNRGARPDEALRVPCLWVDEFAQTHAECADDTAFKQAHDAFVAKRCTQLARAEVRRRGEIVVLEGWERMSKTERRTAFAALALQTAWRLHRDAQNHTIDPHSGKCVSFGLVRMANIDPLYDVARAMYQLGTPVKNARIHLCVYHSQFPLLSRSHIEYQLDTAFDRRGRGGVDPALSRPTIRALLDAYDEPHHIFIVLASPVCEVGRDWDADWAITEPSSMRSLIQLAGRVRRHREGAIARTNIVVFDTNLRYFERENQADPVFCMPGFELRMKIDPTKTNEPHPHDSSFFFHLKSHHISRLLHADVDTGDWAIDAQPRIRQPEELNPRRSLIELEHGRMRDTMLPREIGGRYYTLVKRDATQHWHSNERLWLTGLLPQAQPFRRDPTNRVEGVLLPDEDEESLRLHRIETGRFPRETRYTDRSDQFLEVRDEELIGAGIAPWCRIDLIALLREWADVHDESVWESATKLTKVSLPESEYGWFYHSDLGFKKR